MYWVLFISLLLVAAGMRIYMHVQGIESDHAFSVYAGIVHHEAIPVPSAISYLFTTCRCYSYLYGRPSRLGLAEIAMPATAATRSLKSANSVLLRASYLAAVCLSVWTVLTCLHQADETDKRRVVCVCAQGPHTCAYHGES